VAADSPAQLCQTLVVAVDSVTGMVAVDHECRELSPLEPRTASARAMESSKAAMEAGREEIGGCAALELRRPYIFLNQGHRAIISEHGGQSIPGDR
jgi:hypothetical protein